MKMQSIILKAIHHKKTILSALCLLGIIAASYFALHLKQADNSLAVWFDPQDSSYQAYQAYVKKFKPDRFVIIAFEVDDALSLPALQTIQKLSQQLTQLPSIESIHHLLNLEMIVDHQDTIELQPFVMNLPQTPEEQDGLRNKMSQHRQLLDRFVSEDFKTIALIATTNIPDTYQASARLKKELTHLIEQTNSQHFPVHLSGTPITNEAFNRLIIRDQYIFFFLSVFATFVTLAVLLRSLSFAFIATFTQATVLLYIIALYFLFGFQLNIVSGIIFPILITVCLADSIHVFIEYRKQAFQGSSQKEPIIAVISKLTKPILYTSFTTMAGFLAFTTSSIPPLKYLGLFTALGILIALLITLFVMPCFIDSLSPMISMSSPQSPKIDRFLQRLAQVAIGPHKHLVAIFIFLLSGIMILGVLKLKRETHFYDYFFESNTTRQDLQYIQNHLGGFQSVEMMFKLKDSSDMIAMNPVSLDAIDQFQEDMNHLPETQSSLSFVTLLQRIYQGVTNSDLASLPQTKQELAQINLLAQSMGSHEWNHYVTRDKMLIRLSLSTQWMHSEKMSRYLDQILRIAQTKLEPLGIQTTLTGYTPMMVHLNDNLWKSQIQSLIIALLLIALLMSLLFKNIPIGLISLIPNVLPILFALGFMGFLGLPLNVATILIAAVTMGITVDDTIYYLNNFFIHLKETNDVSEAILKTHRSMGQAIFYTSVILMVGFLIFTFGSFKPTVIFGAVVSCIFFVALFGELLILPLLLSYYGKKK